MAIKERFWSKTRVSDRHEWGGTKCVDWTAFRNRQGYGHFWKDGANRFAHRVAFELFVGEIPEGEGYHGTCVCHRCDRPSCVNPDHLYLGTNKENLEDMTKKGRRNRGENHGRSKITEDAVRLIREFGRRHPVRIGCKGGTCRFLSRWLNVSVPTVERISRGDTWRHVK